MRELLRGLVVDAIAPSWRRTLRVARELATPPPPGEPDADGGGADPPLRFELFGVDVLLDEHLEPWLLELNVMPQVDIGGGGVDDLVKRRLFADLWRLVGAAAGARDDDEATATRSVAAAAAVDAACREAAARYGDSRRAASAPRCARALRASARERRHAGGFERLWPSARECATARGKLWRRQVPDAVGNEAALPMADRALCIYELAAAKNSSSPISER